MLFVKGFQSHFGNYSYPYLWTRKAQDWSGNVYIT